MQQSIVRLLSVDSTNESKYLHLLFPTTSSELTLLNNLLDNYKKQNHALSPLLKVVKKTFKSANIGALSTTIETFVQALTQSSERQEVLLPLLQQHDEVLRLVEHNRPSWIKFAVIYILLGVDTIKQQNVEEYVELATVMIFKLLKKLSKEVSVTPSLSRHHLFCSLDLANK